MTDNSRYIAQIQKHSTTLYEIARPINILNHIGWEPSVKAEFFRHKAQKLPRVDYPSFDAKPVVKQIRSIQQQLSDSVIDGWFYRVSSAIENAALMLSHSGRRDFYHYSSELYGVPTSVLKDESTTSLDLANQFIELIGPMSSIDLGEPPAACHLATSVADMMTNAVNEKFGEHAPEVQVVDNLSANALAGVSRIRLRRTACFTDKDVEQLIQHEAYIHVGTLLNGSLQPLKVFSLAHPGATKTQEGLAVFAELISGVMELDRFRRLADRVIAVQMAIDGADFIEVYRHFLVQTGSQDQAFENARRVFRGGTLTGGAPFTKDIVYLDGLLRVHNFFRAIVRIKRTDCLRLLFTGRLSIEDIPAVAELSHLGLCKPPNFLPDWAKDLRFLLSYLAFTSFLNQIDMSKVEQHYEGILKDIPMVDMPVSR